MIVLIAVMLLITIGVIYLYKTQGPRQRQQLDVPQEQPITPEVVQEKTQEIVEEVKQTTQELTETVKEKAIEKTKEVEKKVKEIVEEESSDDGKKVKTNSIPVLDYDFTKAPGFAYPKALKGEQIVRYSAFTLSYNEEYEQPSWVAYKLTETMIKGDAKRDNELFKEDKKVKTKTATNEDYRGSGYDRGHLAPAADFKFSQEAMGETFYFSNISPQVPSFNRGIWNDLENEVRKWAKKEKEIFVVTGPIFTKNMSYIGKNKVAVPEYYYKVIIDVTPPEYKGIGFIMENAALKEPIYHYAVTIDSVQKKTGLDFFPLLPDQVEVPLETTLELDAWFPRRKRK